MGILRSRQKFGAAALILALSAFLSRLMGLVRDKIISWQFGASGESDMYFAAFVVPDIINYLLAGGFMSITIIPLLAKGFEENEENAWKFFSCVFFWMTIASTILTLGGEIFAAHLARAVAPGFSAEQCARLAFFMRIILPAQIFFLSGACFTALLFLRRQFAVPALTPLIYNGFIIFAGLCLPLFSNSGSFGMTGYCVGVTIGAALGAFALPFGVALKEGVKLRLVWSHPWLGKFLLIALPLMLGQTIVMLDEQFLRVFGSMLGEGSVSLLNYGRRIAQVPVALMGQAIAVASYPFLVRLLAKNDLNQFNETLNKAINTGVELIIPVSSCMIACALPILGIIFQGGKFGYAECLACEPLTQLLLLATPFWIIYMALARGYYAYGDTLTPAITGTIITAICIPAYYLFALPHGAWAITAVSGSGVAAYVIWLMLVWTKRHGGAAFRQMGTVIFKSLSCSLPAAFASWILLQYLLTKNILSSGILAALLALFLCGVMFCLCFCALALLISPGILKKIWRMLKRA